MADHTEESSIGALLRRMYGVAMTPLPQSWLPEIDLGALKARLGSVVPPPVDARGLPQMPAAWAEYARREGLYPPEGPR